MLDYCKFAVSNMTIAFELRQLRHLYPSSAISECHSQPTLGIMRRCRCGNPTVRALGCPCHHSLMAHHILLVKQ